MNEPADDAAITALRRTLTVGREADIAFSMRRDAAAGVPQSQLEPARTNPGGARSTG